MPRRSFLRACLCVAIAPHLVSAATQCYWPNGEDAGTEIKPCSSADGSMCCPDNWQCMDNGLCYYPPDDYYGRYGCTDQSWKSDGCPSNLCTYGMTIAGAEAITQCSSHDNDWCCDANRVDVDCCKSSPSARPFFALADGNAYATIGSSTASSVPNVATITGLASGSGSSSPSSTGGGSSAGSSAGTSATQTSTDGGKSSGTGTAAATKIPSSATPITTVKTSVSTGSSTTQTIVNTLVTTPSQSATSSSTSAPASSSSHNSNLGIIIGCAVGIPLALALLGLAFFLLRRRSKRSQTPTQTSSPNDRSRFSPTPDPYADGTLTPEFYGGAKLSKKGAYASRAGAEQGQDEKDGLVNGVAGNGSGRDGYRDRDDIPELASHPLGPGRPVSAIRGRAELDSGAQFSQGTVPFAPNAVGLGGGTVGAQAHSRDGSNGSGNAFGRTHPGHDAHVPGVGGHGNGYGESWGSAPPGYSPATNSRQWDGGYGPAVEAPDTSVPARPANGPNVRIGGGVGPPNIVEQPMQVQTEGGRYIPYRPPGGHT